ncbi:DUF1049 domain-containing protein [Amycolatopsis rhizosphaerae]|uniref:DUF1049 domain-containing protein n=1 Tax=Amycolatopsis rhizosphaerae TaxID=2053003 RepID=A0A558AW39_9PSEU|nr:lipopolysaccharide assembly protein LapA domain-containing protein [Amycolatopsis rhizosphaerae]TVT28466.1 DUF1049 domain-containing protein [Amycolatopsis rhizosphaerae]
MTAPQDGKPQGRQEGPSAPTKPPLHRTRVSGTWVTVVVALVLFVFLLVFILQNLGNVTVNFLAATGTMPLGVAMLLAAVAGALVVALVGAARIMQLRRVTKRAHRARR